MEIKLYKTKSKKNQMTKVLTDEVNLSGGLVESTDIINPSLKLGANANYFNFNYCYIPMFGRYYYINDIEVNNKCVILHLHCDVLMSHKNDILGSTAHVTRSKNGSRYIKDPLVVRLDKVNWQCRKVGTGIPLQNSYILQVGGGN